MNTTARFQLTLCAAAALLASTTTMTTFAASEGERPTARVRAEIPAEYRWDFSAIYPGWPAWEADMQRMDVLMAQFVKLQGTLKSGPAALLKAYQAYDEIGKLQDRLYSYPQLQRDVDSKDQDIAGRFQRVSALFTKFDAVTAWFQPELLAVPEATVKGWLAATPALKPYAFGITDSFRKQKHVLDAKGERLLSLAGPLGRASVNAYDELSTSDIKFPTIVTSDGRSVMLSPGNYSELLESNPNQVDRA